MSDTMTKRDIQHEVENDAYQAAYDEIAVAAQIKTTQISGKTWQSKRRIPTVSSHVVNDANDKPAAVLHVTINNDFIIDDFATGRSFLVKLTNIVGAVCQAIQFMDTHANNAHIARLYAERFHPEQEELIAAMKLVEQGMLYPAFDKYGENSVITALTFGKALIDGIGVPDVEQETPED